MQDDSVLCQVKVYLPPVEGNLPEWSELVEPRQQWFKLNDAADLVGEPGLGLLLKSLKLRGAARGTSGAA